MGRKQRGADEDEQRNEMAHLHGEPSNSSLHGSYSADGAPVCNRLFRALLSQAGCKPALVCLAGTRSIGVKGPRRGK